jgi:hypothetical protein
MKNKNIVIHFFVRRDASLTQVIYDKSRLPEGIIKWDNIMVMDITSALGITLLGFYMNGINIPVQGVKSIASGTPITLTNSIIVSSEYFPAVFAQGGGLNDLIEFTAIGTVLDAVPD